MAGKKDLERLRRRKRRKQRIIRATVHLFVWFGVAVIYYIGFSIFFDTPFEYQMKHSTDRLRQEYDRLAQRYDSLAMVLDNLSERDRKIIVLRYFRDMTQSEVARRIGVSQVQVSRLLRRTLKKTHQKSINFFKSAKFKEADYREDKELLIDFYNSKGYRNATVVRDSIYAINEKRMGIDIEVSEGNKYYIRDVSWVGNSVYPTDQLQTLFGVKKGDIYDKKTMHKRLGIGKEENPEDMNQIKSLYQNNGYLMSQIEPAETIIGADSIDIQVKIFEGKQFTINEVGITGNQRVDDEVIRRELYVRPGELYDRSLLMQTIRTLGTLGHFNPEAIMPDIKPVSNELVNINWPLEEQASDQFNIAGGWGSGTFVGSVGITLNNLSVRNFFKKGAWRPYPMGQNQRLSISAQTNGTYYKALAMSFTDPWMGGRKPNSFTVSAHISEQNDAYYVWQSPTRYFRTYGVAAGLGKRLTWPDPYFTFYAEASYERYSLSLRTATRTSCRSSWFSRAIRSISRSIRAAVRSSPLRCRRRFPIRSGTARITAIRT